MGGFRIHGRLEHSGVIDQALGASGESLGGSLEAMLRLREGLWEAILRLFGSVSRGPFFEDAPSETLGTHPGPQPGRQPGRQRPHPLVATFWLVFPPLEPSSVRLY